MSEVIQQYGNLALRDKILNAEKAISRLPGAFFGDSENCPLKHTFADGIYVREIFIPKGMLLVGKIHKHSHPNTILSGDVSVLTEEGVKRIKGPCSMISPAGTKRVVYAHEDTIWVTYHLNPTDTKDIEKIEEEIIAKSFEEVERITDESFNNFIDAVSEPKGTL